MMDVGRHKGAINALQAAMAVMPQWDASEHTQHHFADGMYCRVLFRPAGTLIVGKCHRRMHFYIIAMGRVSVTDGDGPAVEYGAGTILVSKPGTKRAVLALEDSVCMTVHRTKYRDLKKIERQLVMPDPLALYDESNKIARLERKAG